MKDRPKQTILFVDDDPMIRRVAERMIGSMGYDSVIAENGRRALDMMEGNDAIDLVVTDHHMPEMGGQELTSNLRSTGGNTKVVMITGDQRVADQVELQEDPNTFFLCKPYSLDAFRKAIKEAIDSE